MAVRSSPTTTPAGFPSHGLRIAAITTTLWLLMVPVTLPAAGVGSVSGNVLDRPIVDVAFVDRGGGDGPGLLTLDSAGDPTLGSARVALLRRDGAWTEVAERTIVLAAPSDEGGVPWFVDLGGDHFAVLASSPDQTWTVVVPLVVDSTAGTAAIVVGGSVVLDGWVESAGAADVDGDGTPELVVSRTTQGDADGRCADTTFDILAGSDLHPLVTHRFIKVAGAAPAVRLAGAALGEWDGRPGIDLLAHAYETCGTPSDPGDRHHLLGVRLEDGSTIVDIKTSATDSGLIVPSLPLVVDVDGDGRDEAIVAGLSDIAVLDPFDHWKRLKLADGDVQPLAAIRRPGDPRSALLAWLDPANADSNGFRVTRIARVDGSLAAVEMSGSPLAGISSIELDVFLARYRTWIQQPMPALIGDLDGDGCQDLLVPYLTAACIGTGPVRPGPKWLTTRPLGLVGPADGRRLIAVQSLDWSPFSGGPYVASPSAAAPGAWRYGPSGSFVLAESPLQMGTRDASTGVPIPVLDTTVSAAGTIDLEGPTGTRLLVRARAVTTTGVPSKAGVDWTPEGFLRTDPLENEFVGMIRVQVPDGTEPGASVGSVPFDIVANVRTGDGSTTDRWDISIAALDGSGDLSNPVRATASLDLTPPALSLDAPLVSPPWPFDATITGTSEAGVSVRLGQGSPARVDSSGAFEIRTKLAPWPQTLEVTAVDPSGNATPASISVMGGLDIRKLPWPAIAAVTIIVAAALSSMRGGRRGRISVPIGSTSEDVDGPIIEELGAGPTRRRD